MDWPFPSVTMPISSASSGQFFPWSVIWPSSFSTPSENAAGDLRESDFAAKTSGYQQT